MKRIEEQARRLDQEYQGIAQLFDQFCQQAGVLAERYHFFNWPDYEESPPLARAFTLENGFHVLVADATARRSAEKRLEESEARFRNLADHAPTMMWVTDHTGYCTYLNRAWYAFTAAL